MKLFTILILMVIAMPFAMADLDDEITEEEQEAFDEILTPVMKIYNFVKYSATTLAALFMVFSAVSFMTSGEDQRKREGAKKSISYIIVGLMVIWAVPYVISFLVG
jgi:hypothetical protein